MESKNNTLAMQRALLKEHFDIELKCFKGLAKGYIIANVEEIADTAMILKIITPDENTKIKCMLNDIFNGVYQESSDKRD